MEDLSRGLEKELKTHARAVSAKKKIEAEFYRIDEFGKVTCISWVRPFSFFLIFLTLISTGTAASFGYLFVHGSAARTELAAKLDLHDQTIQQLVRDKEILMAQLVMSGITPDLEPMAGPGSVVSDREILPPPGAVNSEKNTTDIGSAGLDGEKSPEKLIDSHSTPVTPKDVDGPHGASLKTMPLPVNIVGVDQIRVVSDKGNGDLLVRFDIKNISADLDTISGYVFIVLKQDLTKVSEWLVLPSVPMDKGRPGLFKRGQYFSIAHFKPVNFRVKSSLSPGDFKLATVFVYGDDGSLIAMHDVKLTHKDA